MVDEKVAHARYTPMLTLLAKVLGKKASELEPMLDDTNKIDELAEEAGEAISASFAEGEQKVTAMLTKALAKEGITIDAKALKDAKRVDSVIVTAIKEHFVKADDDDSNDGKGDTDLVKLRKENNDLKTQLAEKDREVEGKLSAKDKEVARTKINLDVVARAKDALTSLKAIVPADAKTAARKFERLKKAIEENNYEWSEKDKDYILVDEEGNPERGENKLPVKLTDWFQDTIAVDYGLRTVDEKDPGGLPDDKGGSNGYEKYKGAAPKTEDEYLKIVSDFTIPLDQRLEVDAAWQTANATP